jgi:hypothetical protein
MVEDVMAKGLKFHNQQDLAQEEHVWMSQFDILIQEASGPSHTLIINTIS